MAKERIRALDHMEVRQIYGSFMQDDFPENELKPLERIMDMMDEEIYECTGLFSDSHMVAYAFFVKHQETGYYLLDYLAVNKAYRSKGYGSIYMEQMHRYFKDIGGIFLECESEISQEAWTQDNHHVAMQRKRRIQFYRNNGAILTNVKSNLFGVDFSILYYPIKTAAPDYYQEMDAIYRIMFPESVLGTKVKLWSGSRCL